MLGLPNAASIVRRVAGRLMTSPVTYTIRTTLLVVLIYGGSMILIPEDDITDIFPTLDRMWNSYSILVQG